MADNNNYYDYKEFITDKDIFEKLKKADVEPTDIYSMVHFLKLVCEIKKIPCFISMAIANNEKGTEYISAMNSPKRAGIELTDDKISQMLLVMSGFKINKMDTEALEDVEMDDDDLKEAEDYSEEEME